MDYHAFKPEEQLCFPLYAASREFIKHYRPYLDDLGLTYTQYIAMAVFWEEKKLSVKELGKRLYLDSGTLTPVLKSLEAKGYVNRSRSKMDERVLEVAITPEGEALKERASSIPQKVSQSVNMPAEDAQLLYDLLDRLLDCLTAK